MVLSGLAAGGANDALDGIITERMAAQKRAELQRQHESTMALQQKWDAQQSAQEAAMREQDAKMFDFRSRVLADIERGRAGMSTEDPAQRRARLADEDSLMSLLRPSSFWPWP